jgi:carbon monoxide dehydrogenase subunit G
VKISETIEVSSPPDKVWDLFQNVPELATCLPGAELTEDKGDGKYAGSVSTKLGPMTATFEGEATVAADPTTRTGNVSGKGVDRRGGSQGQMKMQYAVTATETGTRVTVDADVMLAGAAAQFGRTGLIQEMSKRLIGEFVECVEAKLAAATVEEAAAVSAGEVKGMSLFFSSLWATVVKFVKRILGRAEGNAD